MGFLLLLLILLLAPVVLGILGIVYLCNNDPELKKKGKYFLLSGVILFLLEVLIGFSICSNINLH